MTKEEVLQLLKMSEDDACVVLERARILKTCHRIDNFAGYSVNVIESLADCAFRLRDEVVADKWLDIWDGIYLLLQAIEVKEYCKECKEWRKVKGFDWNTEAKPIHWIAAALLAKIEKDDEQ